MKRPLLAIGVVAVLLLGACSDDDDQVAKVEKDELIRKADAVCTSANDDIRTMTSSGAASNVDEISTLDFLKTELFPRLDKEVGDLKDLGEPKSNRKDWDEIVKDYDAALSNMKQSADHDAVQALADFGKTFAAARQKAQAFGMKECA